MRSEYNIRIQIRLYYSHTATATTTITKKKSRQWIKGKQGEKISAEIYLDT